ncbi:adenylate kinase [Candidatus Woesearchaeota archaeon]|nr:adenylate kinase [Candidatus Woesearchaeota archaeon]
MKIILLGPPGVGKGTIGQMLNEKYKLPKISTGEILRDEVSKRTGLGLKVERYIKRGDLVPSKWIIQMVKHRISKNDCKKGYILDGFPRTVPQAQAIESEGIHVDMVLDLKAPDKVIVNRISSRRLCHDCPAVFDTHIKPPKKKGICDVCGGKLFRRADDEPESVQHRLEVYHAKTEPLIKFFSAEGILIDVDASPDGPKKVFRNVERAVLAHHIHMK